MTEFLKALQKSRTQRVEISLRKVCFNSLLPSPYKTGNSGCLSLLECIGTMEATNKKFHKLKT